MGLYDHIHVDMDYPVQDLGAFSSVQYTGGVFSFAVFVDGWGTNPNGREGNETDYESVCW